MPKQVLIACLLGVILTELFCCHVMTRKYAPLRLRSHYRLSKYLIILLIFFFGVAVHDLLWYVNSPAFWIELYVLWICIYMLKTGSIHSRFILYSQFFFCIGTIRKYIYIFPMRYFPTSNTDNNVKFLLLCLFIHFQVYFFVFIHTFW